MDPSELQGEGISIAVTFLAPKAAVAIIVTRAESIPPLNPTTAELKPHFFARWNKKDFTYLGVGNIIKYEDGYPTKDSKGNDAETIKITLSIKDLEDIIEIEDENYYPFSLEKQLE